MSRGARSCPLCDATDARVTHHIPGDITIVRCRPCGFLFRPTLPDNLAGLYDEGYFRNYCEYSATGRGHDYMAEREAALAAGETHLEDLERIRRPGRLLDVGCAAGFLLEAARRRGWEVVGLDISDYAVSFARQQLRLDVRQGTVEQAAFAEGSFDVITAFEFIEHVPDPAATLSRLRPWLRPDGILAMTTPNAGSWTARRHPERFIGFLEPPHLAYFTRCSMRRLLHQAGFAPLEIRTELAMVTMGTLTAWGAPQPERWRALVNRVAPGLKSGIRRMIGRVCGGPGMKVYARPRQRT